MLSDSTPGRAAPAIAGPAAGPIGLFSAIVRTAPCNRSEVPRPRGAAATGARATLAGQATTDDSETVRSAPPAMRGAESPLPHPGSGVRNHRRAREQGLPTTRSANPLHVRVSP